MAWSSNPDYLKEAKYSDDEAIILEVKKNWRYCVEWESQTRVWYDLDTKFANGDSRNMYQWDNWVIGDRLASNRPCLTINKTKQHNLLIINDAKMNKPGVNIRPVGGDASFEAAQIYEGVTKHIEYISNAETIYDSATTTQVDGGIGYWRILTDYLSPTSHSQEIYIRRVKDPRSVYLDPDINEIDGSDARFGFVYEDMPNDLYKAKYPDSLDVIGSSMFAGSGATDGWLTRDHTRVSEYYRKTQKKERACSFTDPNTGKLVEQFYSKLTPEQQNYFKEIVELEKDFDDADKTAFERPSMSDNIEWFKLAGNSVIDRGKWLGIYIPIVRLVGTETVIDGILDRKGHTRSMLDAQRMYNINTSANVEFGALQTKVPWLAPMAAVEGLEEYWKNANTSTSAWLPWNHVDEDGTSIPAPVRPEAPQSSPGYVQQMQIAQSEMMMVTGQYQAQMGENENAKSGVAINARQRQGDRATYHFIDNLAIAVRFTGKILIDLIPKIYDTPRVRRITATDGKVLNVTVDTKAPAALQKMPAAEGENKQTDMDQDMTDIIFNPAVGLYDVQSDTGPSFATRRQEAFNALTQIAAQNQDFMHIAGDLLWKVADFPEAQALAQRYRKIIPPNVLGEGPDPQTEEMMNKASEHIQLMQKELEGLTQQVKDKEKELDVKAIEADTKRRIAIADASRSDYEAETKRLVALGNSGPGVAVNQIQPIIKQLLISMLQSGAPGIDADDPAVRAILEGMPEPALTAVREPAAGEVKALPPAEPEPAAGALNGNGQGETPPRSSASPASSGGGYEGAEEHPVVKGARKAPDGKFYVPHPQKPGRYMEVMENA